MQTTTPQKTMALKLGSTVLQVPIVSDDRTRRLDRRPHNAEGESLYTFLAKLFTANESFAKPINDMQIAAVVRAQFKDFPEIGKSIDNCRSSRITLWRSVFNRGKMGKPTVCSFRYDDNGNQIHSQSGRILSRYECLQTVSKYKLNAVDVRFASAKKPVKAK